MDHETTQKLMREAIVFLCKTHLGDDAFVGFEVDAIICISRRCGSNSVDPSYNDLRPTVFKFHEHISDKDVQAVEENVNDWLLSGPSQSLANGLIRQPDQSGPSAAKKRKTGETIMESALSGYDHSNTEVTPDLSLVKQEPGYFETSELSIADVKGSRQSDGAGTLGSHSRSYIDKTDTVEVHSSSRDSKTTVGITELEKLVSKPVMTIPPPLKVIPGATVPRLSSNDEFIIRPASRNSDSEHRSVTASDLIDENLDDSTSGMEQSTPRTCDICGSVFADFPTFNVHCATVHSRYACPFCALLFPCESTRERHLFEHTGESADDDGVVDTQVNEEDSHGSTRPSRHSEFGKWQNDYWAADVSGSMDMSDMDMEDGALPAVNGTLYDPQVMTRRGVLSRQTLRAIAQLDPSHPFICDVCRARFAGSSELCDHCASVHHRIPCPYCGRSFSQKASMERHQRQHTGERPFQCTLCDSSYTRKENLQTHLSRMHGSSSTQLHSGSDCICVE